MTPATATLTGISAHRLLADAARRMAKLASTEYATDDRASDAKIGRARIFGSSVCCIRPLAMLRPTKMRLSSPWATVSSRRRTTAMGGNPTPGGSADLERDAGQHHAALEQHQS